MDIVAKRKWFFVLSALVILPGIISLSIPPALKPGIEFTSGTVLNINFEQSVHQVAEEDIRVVLDELGHTEALIQKTGPRGVFIRTNLLSEEVIGKDGIAVSEQSRIEDAIVESIGAIESREVDSVSPIVAAETVRDSIIAVIFAAFGIFAYVTWAFWRIPNPMRYGVAAILALVHDLALIIGIFSILGKTLNLEVNSMFIVGVLTVLGYSVNDTIVVFDRIRENVLRNVDRPLPVVVNASIIETIGRSLNTSITTLLVLMSLLVLGGETIRGFLLVLSIGVVVGSYSSLFVAAQFLVIWDRGELRRILRRRATVKSS